MGEYENPSGRAESCAAEMDKIANKEGPKVNEPKNCQFVMHVMDQRRKRDFLLRCDKTLV
jgi:hypothetical protein